MGEVTRILQTMGSQGEAADQLLPLVYEELHKLAAHKMTGEAPGQTLQATALVHEAYLRLVRSEQPPWQSQAHFFAPAGEAMRRILIDNALMSGHPCVVIPHDGSDVCLAFVGPGEGLPGLHFVSHGHTGRPPGFVD